MDKWTETRTAYQVARLGTVSAAAEALGYHRATVNRHIDALEEELGARIFIRHARGYTLTELGEAVLRVAQKTEELMDDLSGRAKGKSHQLEGEIKISVLPPMANILMAPANVFRRQNPGCKVVIYASDDLARLEYGEAHIAVRAGPKPQNPDYIVQEYLRVGLNLYAHDSYIEKNGMPRLEEGTEGHEFIMPATLLNRMPFRQWATENVKPSQIAMASDNSSVLTDAVLSGVGLGFLTQIDVQGRSDVHPLLSADPTCFVPLWLVTHMDLHRTEKVQAMLKCLKAHAD